MSIASQVKSFKLTPQFMGPVCITKWVNPFAVQLHIHICMCIQYSHSKSRLPVPVLHLLLPDSHGSPGRGIHKPGRIPPLFTFKGEALRVWVVWDMDLRREKVIQIKILINCCNNHYIAKNNVVVN